MASAVRIAAGLTKRPPRVVSAAVIATTWTRRWPAALPKWASACRQRVIEAPQNLENFFRIHGRIRPAEALDIYQLRLQAEALRLSRGFDQLLCLDELAVDHYEHQIDAALRALRDMRGRALLADEVGLGKTIEAGIVMKELMVRGLVRSALVLTPASLTEQWREELSIKFHEEFTVMDRTRDWNAVQDAEEGRWIVSLDRAKLKSYADVILARV